MEHRILTAAAESEADIWARIINPRASISPPVARRILKLSFSKDDRARMQELADLSQSRPLSLHERAEMDRYENVGSLLTILKLKCRKILEAQGEPD